MSSKKCRVFVRTTDGEQGQPYYIKSSHTLAETKKFLARRLSSGSDISDIEFFGSDDSTFSNESKKLSELSCAEVFCAVYKYPATGDTVTPVQDTHDLWTMPRRHHVPLVVTELAGLGERRSYA